MNFKILKRKPDILDEIEEELLKKNLADTKLRKNKQRDVMDFLMFRS